MERRLSNRHRTVYRPAYVRKGTETRFAILRNVSDDGACLDGVSDFKPGETVEYSFTDTQLVSAKVVWVRDGKIGVHNSSVHTSDRFHSENPHRSIRLPINAPAEIFVDRLHARTEIRNLSQRGACIVAPEPLTCGQLITIEFGGLSIEAAVVKWVRDGKAGIQFKNPIDFPTLSSVISKIQEVSSPQERSSIAA